MRHSRVTWVLARVTWVLALALAAGLGLAAGDADAKKTRRFGIEGSIVSYDEANKVLTVKVRETNVPGNSLSGNTVGGKAPGDIKRHSEQQFAVEPTGSVLRRTVVKAMTGGGLDTTGTAAGFKRALAAVPDGRPVLMSLEDNDPAAVKGGAPKYKILMIQIQYTEEELRERWERLTVEE